MGSTSSHVLREDRKPSPYIDRMIVWSMIFKPGLSRQLCVLSTAFLTAIANDPIWTYNKAHPTTNPGHLAEW